MRVLLASKGIEKTKDREQVVDKINKSLGSHGGDTGSKPVGTAGKTTCYQKGKPVGCRRDLCSDQSGKRGPTWMERHQIRGSQA